MTGRDDFTSTLDAAAAFEAGLDDDRGDPLRPTAATACAEVCETTPCGARSCPWRRW